jgi:phosphatidylethanolamine-binding protein (PEBP) family uncharacterized protein
MNSSTIHKGAARVVDFKQLKVSSTMFQNEGMIPSKYTCDGKNISPPLNIEHIPEESKCLVLIIDDPDAPFGIYLLLIISKKMKYMELKASMTFNNITMAAHVRHRVHTAISLKYML